MKKTPPGENDVDLYCDLHRKCSSLKALSGPNKGRVVDKPTDIVLANVTLRVSAASVRRVLETGVRSVHAYARGTRTELSTTSIRDRDEAIRVRYNPFKRGEFFDAASGEAITKLAFLGVSGKTAWGIKVDASPGKT
jgi:hypothetical protein